MGNEKSSVCDIKYEETIDSCEYWTQESASLTNQPSRVSVFKQVIDDSSKVAKLLSLSQNLKLYRHPYILRFISTFKSNGIFYMVTEDVKPLSHVVRDLFPIQLCLGLRNILNAIIFLREMTFDCIINGLSFTILKSAYQRLPTVKKLENNLNAAMFIFHLDIALKSHNDLRIESIYVNYDGYWKLGRLESMTSLQSPFMSNDAQGFVRVTIDILSEVDDSDAPPGLLEFKNYCIEHVSDEYFLQELYSHPFFQQDFINIYSFLEELPARNEEEKSDFLKTLAESLIKFPEKLVAQQLGGLLLSRLVLLNEVAQRHLLPKILIPKCDNNESLFSQHTLKEYLGPKLLNMFGLRDSQIRLILLRYFPSLCLIFTKQQLELKILPELLAGVRDINEQLVSATLHSLADLVPVLGASVVVGQHRTKLFADGRPLINLKKVEKELTGSHSDVFSSASSYLLTERQSPDGGEDYNLSTNAVKDENAIKKSGSVVSKSSTINVVEENILKFISSTSEKSRYLFPLQGNEDLHSLDVKSSRTETKKDSPSDDIELIFKDMEPVILQTATMNISRVSSDAQKNKFEPADVNLDGVSGWEDDVSDIIGIEV